MSWSLRLGSIAGIGIFVHWTFSLIIIFVLLLYIGGGHTLGVALTGVLFILAVFGCVVLHELGHALWARRYGIQTRDIILLPIGGVARLERMPEKPEEEFLVAMAGPAVNVVIAAVLFLLLTAFFYPVGGWESVSDELRVFAEMREEGVPRNHLALLMWVNLFLVGFNLLPAFPMDGGRALRALLGLRMDYVVATRIAAGIGQAMAILFALLALLALNPFLFFIAIFVFLGAQAEAQMVESTSAIRGLRVHDGMMTHYLTLTEDDDLAHAVEQLLAGSQQDFPVVNDENEVIGLLTRNRLVRTLSEKGSEIRVGEVMRQGVKTVEEDEDLEEVHQTLRMEESPTLPVLRHGRLVGLLTMENIGEMVMINSALRRRGKPGEVEKILEHR